MSAVTRERPDPRKSNASSIQELTSFAIAHSVVTKQVFLNASFTDNMAGIAHWSVQKFPDQFMCISRDKAEQLMRQLQRTIDYLDAGIDAREFTLSE